MGAGPVWSAARNGSRRFAAPEEALQNRGSRMVAAVTSPASRIMTLSIRARLTVWDSSIVVAVW